MLARSHREYSMQDKETGFTEHSIRNADGLTLHVRAYGAGNPGTGARLPVICLAGLSRNSRDFHPLAVALSSPKSPADFARRVFCLDYRGRGLSDWDNDKSRYQLPIEAADVIAVCAALEISSAHLHRHVSRRPDPASSGGDEAGPAGRRHSERYRTGHRTAGPAAYP